jgi:hypothetical protein
MPFPWDGVLQKYMRLLRSFIEDGSLSLNTHSDHDKDYLYSIKGLVFERDSLKTFQVRYTPTRRVSEDILLVCAVLSQRIPRWDEDIISSPHDKCRSGADYDDTIYNHS